MLRCIGSKDMMKRRSMQIDHIIYSTPSETSLQKRVFAPCSTCSRVQACSSSSIIIICPSCCFVVESRKSSTDSATDMAPILGLEASLSLFYWHFCLLFLALPFFISKTHTQGFQFPCEKDPDEEQNTRKSLLGKRKAMDRLRGILKPERESHKPWIEIPLTGIQSENNQTREPGQSSMW